MRPAQSPATREHNEDGCTCVISTPQPSCDRDAPPTLDVSLETGGDGGHQRVEGQPLAAPPLDPAAAARQATTVERWLMWLGFFLHLATQLVSLRAWSSLPASELAQRLASIAYSAALPLLPTLMPLAYLRHRQPIKLAWRIGFFSFPLLRQPRGIQRVLEAAPSPGAAGALLDLAKTAWGCRLMAVAMAPLVMPLPLLPHLAAQLYAVSVVGDNGSLCTAPLLAHPASAARIAALHAAMSFAAAPCTAQPPGTLLAASGQRQQCDAFLAFLRLLLGIVLPTVVVTKAQLLEAVGCKRSWLPDGAAGSGRPAALEQALERGVRRLAGRSWLAGPSGSNSGGVDEPDTAADAGSVPSQMPRALLWWLLLCYCWLLSTLLA